MLATITDYKQRITLIQNSGIQFLDFAIKLNSEADIANRFIRKSANGPLLRLIYNENNGKFVLPGETNVLPEAVNPESNFTVKQSLSLLSQAWLPLPFFRFNPPRTFLGGPYNWARVQVLELDEPDDDGNTHRICLAFDTKVYPESHGGLVGCGSPP